MADEIMKETWRIKDEFSAKFPSIEALFRHLEQRERESGRQYVKLVKKRKKPRRMGTSA